MNLSHFLEIRLTTYNKKSPESYTKQSCIERITRAILNGQLKMKEDYRSSPEEARKTAEQVAELIYGKNGR